MPVGHACTPGRLCIHSQATIIYFFSTSLRSDVLKIRISGDRSRAQAGCSSQGVAFTATGANWAETAIREPPARFHYESQSCSIKPWVGEFNLLLSSQGISLSSKPNTGFTRIINSFQTICRGPTVLRPPFWCIEATSPGAAGTTSMSFMSMLRQAHMCC